MCTANRNTVYSITAACALLLLGSVFGCRDPITTNDPRQAIITTKVAVMVATSPITAADLVPGNSSIITVTVYDTNQNNGVMIVSTTITGMNASDFTNIDAAKFPLTINARDSATFRIRFVPKDTGNVVATLNLEADAEGINVSVPLNSFVPNVIVTLVDSVSPPSQALLSGEIITVFLRDTNRYNGVTVQSAVVTSANGGQPDFSITGGMTLPHFINAKELDTLRLLFAPTHGPNISDTLSIYTDAHGKSVAIPLNYIVSGVAVVVTISAPSPSPVIGNVSTITVSLRDTNQSGSVKIISALVTGDSSADFAINNNQFPLNVQTQQPAQFVISLTPTGQGPLKDTLNITADPVNGINVSAPFTIGGLASNLFEKLAVDSTLRNFSNVVIGDTLPPVFVTVTDSGTKTIQVVRVIDSIPADPAFVYTLPSAQSLAPNQKMRIPVQFLPQSAGPHTALLKITGDTLPPLYVTLTGTGVPNTGGNGADSIYPDSIHFYDSVTVLPNTVGIWDNNTGNTSTQIDSIVLVIPPSDSTDSGVFLVSGFGTGVNNSQETIPIGNKQIAVVEFNGDTLLRNHDVTILVYYNKSSVPFRIPVTAGPP